MHKRLCIEKRSDGCFGVGYFINDNFIRFGSFQHTEEIIIEYAKMLTEKFPHEYLIDEYYCKYCDSRLIFDNLSKKYGNYCPNLNCEFIK